MTSDLIARAQQLLVDLAGSEAVLREDQAAAVRSLVEERRRVLVVQRTGWGKSAVYFLAAKLLREQGCGPTILVSPLLALMRDQLRSARRMGLVAETINSSNVDDWKAIEQLVADDQVDVLAISPERLNNPSFVTDVLPDLTRRVGMVVIDEAHCISEWGHDFRPDYQRIRDALARVDPGTPVLATTATATDWVIADVAEQLGAEPLTLRGTLDRPSLALSVVPLDTPAERLAWLAQHVPDLPGSGIVYCLTQAAAEQTAAWLAGQGLRAAAYSGSTPPDERERLEKALQANELDVLCATSALGMGFDKPDLGFAVNLGAPASITAYYQMVGRAGRALEHAVGVLLPGKEDERVWNWFEQVSFPPRALAEAVVHRLERADGPMTEAKIEAFVDIKRTRLSSLLKVLDIEGAVRRVAGGWVRTAQPWAYDQGRYDRVRASRREDQQRILDYQATEGCRMGFLRRALDDPEHSEGWRCDRCDRCTGRSFDAPAANLVAAADQTTREGDVVLPARKMWPTGMAGRAGRIPADRQALDGRALCEVGAPGWGALVDELLVTDDPVVDETLLRGLVHVVKRWGWPEGRATWVTWVPSTRRPEVTSAVARSLGALGNLPVRESLRRVRPAPPQSEMGNSAHRCGNVGGALELTIAEDELPGGPVLLIDDTWSSGWTVTVVADLLRSAGAGPVYPLALRKE